MDNRLAQFTDKRVYIKYLVQSIYNINDLLLNLEHLIVTASKSGIFIECYIGRISKKFASSIKEKKYVPFNKHELKIEYLQISTLFCLGKFEKGKNKKKSHVCNFTLLLTLQW